MNKEKVAVVNTKQMNEMIDELRYLQATLIPLLSEDSSLVKNLEDIIVKLDKANANLNNTIEKKVNESFTDIMMTNKLLFYAIVSDPEALNDSIKLAKQMNDKKFLDWINQKLN